MRFKHKYSTLKLDKITPKVEKKDGKKFLKERDNLAEFDKMSLWFQNRRRYSREIASEYAKEPAVVQHHFTSPDGDRQPQRHWPGRTCRAGQKLHVLQRLRSCRLRDIQHSIFYRGLWFSTFLISQMFELSSFWTDFHALQLELQLLLCWLCNT